LPKLERNVERDRTKLKLLESQGWEVLVVWQCETRDIDALTERLRGFVDES